MLMRSEQWFKEAHRRAELGDGAAQLELAWEYVRADNVTKNLSYAFLLLKQLETSRPEFARFNLAKIKILEQDKTYYQEILEDCEAGYGPALYLMGVQTFKNQNDQNGRATAMQYYRRAAAAGHLPSEFLLWRLEKIGLLNRILSSFKAFSIFFRMVAIRLRNIDDERTLT